MDIGNLAQEEYCYVTTTGRVTGRPHRIEIWFGTYGSTIYLLSGGATRSDWVKNMKAKPAVDVRIGETHFAGNSRLVSDADEERRARELLAAKYYKWSEGKKMNDWATTALPVAIDLVERRA